MVKCPACGHEFHEDAHLLKTWKFRYWIVRYYHCSNCGQRFRLYVNGEGKRRSWTIPKARR